MPHVPAHNPTITGGRQSRFVQRSAVHRNFRTDHVAERNLQTLGAYLAGVEPADNPSISLLLRRAVAAYRSLLDAMAATPGMIEEEKRRVREGSVLPCIDPNKQKRSAETLKNIVAKDK